MHPRLINDDLRAVAELFAFVAANPAEARAVLGAGPWQQVTDPTPPAGSVRSAASLAPASFNDEHYVDDHALAQITAALPLLGLPRDAADAHHPRRRASRSPRPAWATRRPCG